jgi:hypothetical protein
MEYLNNINNDNITNGDIFTASYEHPTATTSATTSLKKKKKKKV